MKIFITGGTGFVGRTLAPALIRSGHGVCILTRSGKGDASGVSWVEGDPAQKGKWQEAVREHEVIINLAGASIFTRWTEEAKKKIRDSRIFTTRNLVEAMEGGKVKTFFSTSAIGYYGFHGDENLTEESPPGADFLSLLARDWEAEAKEAEKKGCRLVVTRFGIVLGEKGGALGQMIPLFRKYLGGPLGSGEQWFSWIHIDDLTRAFLFLLEHPEISGPVNFTAPNPVRNKELAQWLGRIMGRPAFLPAPGFMLKLALGEFGSILLKGQRVLPRKLLEAGFSFTYPEIDRALRQVIRGTGG
ncbi:MAG: epimerase [Deltaproteobacteria bacterium SM23_61]|nr:MAG: epimerase [Deltaproteobacteria bacterium SM23_61]